MTPPVACLQTQPALSSREAAERERGLMLSVVVAHNAVVVDFV